ncbi:YerC/YecD family TrpR-related protein [Olsenella urininfantis]|uniref:YerC/YecD family TrpR-related protein n=1 Tax=Olsenella urininfantis TaxID=1871033 RepID=UPI000986EDB9|nr:YerC/YecD family TrpR-related protein [Olsenella urininfantis]
MPEERDDELATPGVERLFEAVCQLGDPSEARAFLLDLCSRREIMDLAQRLEVAGLLRSGSSYVEVSAATGASSTTVSRVSKCLNGPEGGYRLVLGRLGGACER